MRKRVAVALMGAGLLVLGAQAEAQEAKGGQPPVQFNFAPPGARSLGMGAAFIGLADDATAAESNPAGLTILTKPEISGHFRSSRFEDEFPNTVEGRGLGTFEETVQSPSFFSIVVPKGPVAVSAYYQRSVDYANSSSFTGRFTDRFTGIVFQNTDSVATDFLVENVGLSLAVKLGPKASVGGSVRRTNTKVAFDQRVEFTAPAFPGFREDFTAGIDDSADKITFNAGVLVSPTPKISLGAVYKKGATFEFTQNFTETTVFPGSPIQTGQDTRASEFTIPDSFGGGVAIRPTDHWTILADVVRITYSDISAEETLFAEFSEGGAEDIKDGTEIHVGTEYTFSVGSSLLALRAGIYKDPDHDGLVDVDTDQIHKTFGAGIVLNNKVQLDAAVNLAETVKEGLVSLVLRF
jgi:long-chain fatty acid transport protein